MLEKEQFRKRKQGGVGYLFDNASSSIQVEQFTEQDVAQDEVKEISTGPLSSKRQSHIVVKCVVCEARL